MLIFCLRCQGGGMLALSMFVSWAGVFDGSAPPRDAWWMFPAGLALLGLARVIVALEKR